MPNQRLIYKFNRFPIHKERFIKLIYSLYDYNGDFISLFATEPIMYDKVYVTMKDTEAEALSKHFGSPALIEDLKICDAIYDRKNRFILLHVPAMVRNISGIPTDPSDEGRRALFVIHFFACLFHELVHANHISRLMVNELGRSCLGQAESSKSELITMEQLEDVADRGEDKYLSLLTDYLTEIESSWIDLTHCLFDWEKLQKHIH